MATITINIPDAQVNRVLDAFTNHYGYDPAGGLTKAQFAKQQLALHIRRVVRDWERHEAELAALQAVPDPGDVDVT